MFKSKPRSFVLRKGRVTSAQRSAIINLWKDYVIEPESEQVKFAEVGGIREDAGSSRGREAGVPTPNTSNER